MVKQWLKIFHCHFFTSYFFHKIELEDFYLLRGAVVSLHLSQGSSCYNTPWCQPTSTSPSSFLAKRWCFSARRHAQFKLITSPDSPTRWYSACGRRLASEMKVEEDWVGVSGKLLFAWLKKGSFVINLLTELVAHSLCSPPFLLISAWHMGVMLEARHPSCNHENKTHTLQMTEKWKEPGSQKA